MTVPYHFPRVLISVHWRDPLWPGLSPPLSHPLQQPCPGVLPGCLMGSVPGNHSKCYPLRQWFSTGVILHPTTRSQPRAGGSISLCLDTFLFITTGGVVASLLSSSVWRAIHRSAHRMLPAMTDQLQNVHQGLRARNPAFRKHLFSFRE